MQIDLMTNEKADFIREQYFPYLTQSQGLILNADFDGIFSYGILHAYCPNIPVYGFYLDDRFLILTDDGKSCEQKFGLESLLSLESDMYLMPSIGQHITLGESSFGRLNPNLLRGVSRSRFRNKYPFGTAAFLFRILNMSLPSRGIDRALRCLFFSDGGLKNVQTYTKNCQDWWEWLNIKCECDFSDLRRIAMDANTESMDEHFKENFGSSNGLLQYQCQNNIYTFNDLDSYLQTVNAVMDRMQMPAISLPNKYHLYRQYFTAEIKGNNDVTDAYKCMSNDQRKLHDIDIISDALVQFGKWSVTLDQKHPIYKSRYMPIGRSQGVA